MQLGVGKRASVDSAKMLKLEERVRELEEVLEGGGKENAKGSRAVSVQQVSR